jgi:hypothetical protein
MKTKLLRRLREEAETESLWVTDDFKIYCRYYKRWIRAYILRRVAEFLQEKYGAGRPSVLCVSEEGNIKHYGGGWPHRGGRKLFLEEQLTAARLGCMRVWNLKEKLIKQQSHAEDNV